ncbi:MAG: glutamine-hydrolyzing GMP synthase [Candidatus Sericytochromatia bacterium]|nr:glutamine-hydrolyzing GMP synthase [Candidatus Sericytochromatia bacterium]
MTHERLAVLDFGSQYTPLIARRLRELGVLAEIFPADVSPERLVGAGLKGVILSGGPASVTEPDSPRPAEGLLAVDVPVLGVCYGMQLLNQLGGGRVVPGATREYGRAELTEASGPLFDGLSAHPTVWMSHGDRLDDLAPGWRVAARTNHGIVAAIAHETLPRHAVQFHPEVTHTPEGRQILSNFVFGVCGCRGDWSVQAYMEESIAEVRAQVGQAPVIVLVSGGVDSTVTAALLARALPPEQVFPIHIDSGLMRAGESEAVATFLREAGLVNLRVVHAQPRFLEALSGVADPEEKRRRIGDVFIEVQNAELAQLGFDAESAFLAQGTLYTDMIESGASGAHTATIKTHHNVGTPLVRAMREAGRLVEPCRGIFKDEVRALGLLLGLPRELVMRHPFPGPGLAIRVLGAITPERLAIVREADRIYLEEIRRAGLYDAIWQAFAALLPVHAVGVQGDGRTVGEVVALRAVDSVDGMTADFHPVPFEVLGRAASRIVNEIRGVTRVVFDVTSKPPATIEWE